MQGRAKARRYGMNEIFRSVVSIVAIGCLLGCAEPAEFVPATASGMRFLGDGAVAGFARALEARSFTFPQDHGSHDDYRTEWWYFTGNVRTLNDRHFGFELTFFRYALVADAPPRESAWATRQIWLAHLALTDTSRARFDAAERIGRGALDLAGARPDRFAVWLDDWSAIQAEPGEPIHLRANNDEFGIDLWLEPRKRVVLQGDAGLDAKGPESGNASYYYSWPRLDVIGNIDPVGEAPVAVTGLGWLDREWGTSALSAGVVGWDWFALQLSDGRDLMFYRLRTASGHATRWSGGSIVAADGTSERLTIDDVMLDARDYWTSPTTGVRYPVEWRMRVDGHGLDLLVRPVIPNQELDLSVRYWEGAVAVESIDPSSPITGDGYLELAGYERE